MLTLRMISLMFLARATVLWRNPFALLKWLLFLLPVSTLGVLRCPLGTKKLLLQVVIGSWGADNPDTPPRCVQRRTERLLQDVETRLARV